MDRLRALLLVVLGVAAAAPALVAQIYSQLVAAEVKMTLGAVYPDEHPVRLVHAAGTPAEGATLYLVETDEPTDLRLVAIDVADAPTDAAEGAPG